MSASKTSGDSAVHDIAKQKPKRRKGRRDSYTRFTSEEHEMLLDGIRRYGVGHWKRILCAYNFHEKRTAVDLKDKYRNILRAKERERWSRIQRVTLKTSDYNGKIGVNVGSQWMSVPVHSSLRPITRIPVVMSTGGARSEQVGHGQGGYGAKGSLLQRFSPFLYSSGRDVMVQDNTFDKERWSSGQGAESTGGYGRGGMISSREMSSTEVGCGARAAMRLERLLCPTDKNP